MVPRWSHMENESSRPPIQRTTLPGFTGATRRPCAHHPLSFRTRRALPRDPATNPRAVCRCAVYMTTVESTHHSHARDDYSWRENYGSSLPRLSQLRSSTRCVPLYSNRARNSLSLSPTFVIRQPVQMKHMVRSLRSTALQALFCENRVDEHHKAVKYIER